MKWVKDFTDWLTNDDSGVRIIVFIIAAILLVGIFLTGSAKLSPESGRTIDNTGWQSPGS